MESLLWEQQANSKRREGRMGRFEGLHTDLVLDILSRLNPTDIIFKVGRVCSEWRTFANSQQLRLLSSKRAAEDPWIGGAEAWMVLQNDDGDLIWYPSLAAVLNLEGRHLDPCSFSMGPPGHEFEFIASSIGLVCGRLVDFHEAGSHDMTLAVGNPLTNVWRILPRVALPRQPLFVKLVMEFGNYTLEIRCVGSAARLVYCSRSQAWKPDEQTHKIRSRGVVYRGVGFVKDESTLVAVERASMPDFIVEAGTLVAIYSKQDEDEEVNKEDETTVEVNKQKVLDDKVNKVFVAFLPNFATP